jgi:signal transduction histidine kinase
MPAKMKKDNNSETVMLRQTAEVLLKKKSAKSAPQLSVADTLKLIHELELHQVELKLQNEELLLARTVEYETLEKYVELYDFAPSGYFTLSGDGEIIELNLSGANMLRKERSRLKKSRFSLFVSDDTKPIFRLFLGEIFKSKAKESCEVTLKTNGNLPMYVHLTGIAASNGERCLVTVVDITERITAESQIREMNEELEQRVIQRTMQFESANKELESFSYSVSHDLRTPLRSVHGYIKILLEDYENKLDEEGKRLCGIILSGVTQMNGLIDDLLSFSKIGRTDIDPSILDMKSIAGSVFNDLTDEKTKAQYLFKTGKLHKTFGDSNLMRLVWINLISNAIKYSSKKSFPEILISSQQEGNMITYSIKDNGVGFEMEYVNKLFGVFQRLHSESEFKGNGVGLAIVQRIILRHGGRVWAEGEVGKGATFYFTSPAGY